MRVNTENVTWDSSYDVVVLGFGGAGATAARFAADAGSKVLLTDSAPLGHEGGNTRYSAQLMGTGDDFDETKKYYKRLTYPMKLDEDMIDTFVEGMVNMRGYVKKYLGVEPFSYKNDKSKTKLPVPIEDAIFEFPEYEGVKSYDFTTVHDGMFDASLWKILRKNVTDRSDKIDVWLSSPAKNLLQDQETGAIVGVQIDHNHIPVNIRATSGVVLAVGGFENNQDYVQTYLSADHLVPLGTTFNKGDGLRMAQDVGADLWHMDAYEALGLLNGMVIDDGEERGRLILGWPESNHGSVITVADDGSRYFREDEPNRHGHIYDHGTWRVSRTNVHPYLIFDQKQFDKIKKAPLPMGNALDKLVKAENLTDLAQIMGADAEILKQTVSDFNEFAKNGRDFAFNRDPKTMTALDGNGPYYALPLSHDVLNTQGGPRRNARAEILDTNGDAIPNLYGAGELGGISANQYQGGGNLAECLIFGKIAGENAAHNQQDNVAKTDANTGASEETSTSDSDVAAEPDLSDYKLGKNQFLGVSENGMGGRIVVRVTYAKDKLNNVEVVEQSETGNIGGEAIKALPAEMVKQNSAEVDVVSGASVSSRSLMEAVEDALSKVEGAVKQ